MKKNEKKERAITLIALIITIIILLILSGIAIAALKNTGLFEKTKEAKNEYLNSVDKENEELAKMNSYITSERENTDKISDLIEKVTFEIKKVTGTTIQIQINTKASNPRDVRGYYVYKNGEVVAVGENNLITIKNLNFKTEYIIKCGIIDKNGKIKESAEGKATTLEEEILYDGQKFPSLISEFSPFRVDNASKYDDSIAFGQRNNFYELYAMDTDGRVGINTKDKIDLTNIQKIEIDTVMYNNYGPSFTGTEYLGIYDKNDSTLDFTKFIKYSTNADVVQNKSERKTLELDVSDIEGEYYIKIISLHPSNIRNYGFLVHVYSLKLK